VRELPSEVPVGRDEGLAEGSIVNCDQISLIPRRLIDRDAAGTLGPQRIVELDRALRFALGIVF
jgi:mRNA-degrading endonuclease toxin of MazEF toxin-antitoxin module